MIELWKILAEMRDLVENLIYYENFFFEERIQEIVIYRRKMMQVVIYEFLDERRVTSMCFISRQNFL